MAVVTAITRRQGVVTGALADRMAKFLERYPHARDIYISSAIDGDHGAVSHHYGLTYNGSPTAALDISAGTSPDDAKMRDFAKWLYDNYAEFTVELIHSTPFADDDGFYVKNQVRNPGGSIFGGPQAIGHFDHIHWATSENLMARLEQAGKKPTITFETALLLQPSMPISPAPGEPTASVGIANNAPVWGWDASDYDWDRGPMDLVAAQRDGISFFVHKSTEGVDWKAKHYKEALERARNAGIPVLGAYHFLWPEDIEAQVNFWMDYVDTETPWWKDVPWIWQIDAEKSKGAARIPNPDEIRRAVETVKARMAVHGTTGYVIVYAPRWAYADTLGGGYDIWNSNYNGSGSPRPFAEQYNGVTDFQAGWNLMSGRKPKILQFTSDGQVGRQNTCDVNKFDGDLHALIRLCGRDPGRISAPVDIKVTEKVLPFDRSVVPQETGYWCGPASTQVVLNSRGIIVEESALAEEIGTYVGGTDTVEWIDERVFDKRLPDANYTSVHMPDDPPTNEQRESLWGHIVRSIDAGFGVIMNWVAPPNNYPRGVKGSVSPSYSGGTVFHYVACMGYDTTPGARALYIADSGFNPFVYWVSFDQAATLLPPKAYTYAATVSPREDATHPPDGIKPPEVGVVDVRSIQNAAAGIDSNGRPYPWRFAYSRHPRDFNQIINDPDRGPWHCTQPDGTEHAGHTDAYEQIVPLNEQIAWTHVFSDGIKRDSGDVLLELMEFAIQWRIANKLPTSAFTHTGSSSGALTLATHSGGERAAKRSTRTATKPNSQRTKRT